MCYPSRKKSAPRTVRFFVSGRVSRNLSSMFIITSQLANQVLRWFHYQPKTFTFCVLSQLTKIKMRHQLLPNGGCTKCPWDFDAFKTELLLGGSAHLAESGRSWG